MKGKEIRCIKSCFVQELHRCLYSAIPLGKPRFQIFSKLDVKSGIEGQKVVDNRREYPNGHFWQRSYMTTHFTISFKTIPAKCHLLSLNFSLVQSMKVGQLLVGVYLEADNKVQKDIAANLKALCGAKFCLFICDV